MKRIITSSFLIFIILLLVSAGSWAETAPPTPSTPENPSLFVGGSHPGTGKYRSRFLMQTAKQGTLTLSVELSVYRPEQAADLLAQVSEDMQVISAALPVADKPLTVYVV